MRVIFGCLAVLLGAGLIGCDRSQAPTRPSGANKVGYVEVTFLDQDRSRPLAVGLWYPADDGAREKRVVYDRGYLGFAAEEAPYNLAAARRPLILLSHGAKGTKGTLVWLAESLAGEGYTVASVDHWLDTARSREPEETIKVWHRPVDLSFVLTSLLADPVWGSRIDPNHIGAAGHSSGGYTVLALAGAVFDHEAMGAYCQSPQRGTDCDLTDGIDMAAIDFSEANKDYRDPRVKAVLAMAPALGRGIKLESLGGISIPVQIIVAADDEVIPPAFNAERYAASIAGSSFMALPRGGHFVFMAKCTWTAGIITRFVTLFDVCGNYSTADRGRIRRDVSTAAARFFDTALSR
jgi:predicted dienelactone hydrolase